jgi:hypothetical protein
MYSKFNDTNDGKHLSSMVGQNDYSIFIVKFAIGPVGVFMHLLLLIALLKDPLKCFRNSGTYLVGNLAVSDFLVCLLAYI